MTDKELVDKLRSTQSRSKRALLDATADKIENQQNHIRALLQVNEALRASAPVVHGHWNKLSTSEWECSHCGETIGVRAYMESVMNYCNYCGAKMDEEEQDG